MDVCMCKRWNSEGYVKEVKIEETERRREEKLKGMKMDKNG